MHRFVLNWDEYFMGLSLLAALRSKDPNSQVGAAIVSPQQRILGTGYNGFIAGVDESQFPWEREGEWLDTKYPYVVHAEANAILNSTQSDLRDCRIYVTLFPCNECAKQIAQKGIREIIYLQDKYPDSPQGLAARRILDAVGVSYRQADLPHLPDELQRLAANLRQVLKNGATSAE
jgi:dCMP deaminase